MLSNTDVMGLKAKRSKWNNIRVLMLLPNWDNTYKQKNIGKLLDELRVRGADFYLLCSSSSGTQSFHDKYPSYTLIESREPWPSFKGFWVMLKTLYQIRPDIVLWTYSGYGENFVLALLRLLRVGPFYIIKSDSLLPAENGRDSLKNKFTDFMFFRLPAWFSSLIIVETKEVLSRARDFYGRYPRLYLMPNGVPLNKFMEYRNIFNCGSAPVQGPFILFTGRVMHSKGVDLLISAFVVIAEKLPTWKLVIVGPVWEAGYIEDCKNIVSKAGLSDRILFVDYAEGKDLYRWYHFAEIYVLPSREEGLANRLPEAMYFENPIVAFDVGQTKSMIDESCGVLLPPEDVEGLSCEILNLALDEKLRKIKALAARRRIEAAYDDDKLISDFLSVVEESIL